MQDCHWVVRHSVVVYVQEVALVVGEVKMFLVRSVAGEVRSDIRRIASDLLE